MASKFIPRQAFQVSENIPRSYFLGHHRAGLLKMRSMMESIDHVFECRDFRIPFTSINPLFEHVLGNKPRTIVYTKRDIAGGRNMQMQQIEKRILDWDRKAGTTTFIMKNYDLSSSIDPFINHLKVMPIPDSNITGYRVMVVGMPNVGKSTLINRCREKMLGLPAVAKTGNQPGVTRKIGGPVKLIDRGHTSIYMYDTPGVFTPYVASAESMVKLALCGAVKSSLISDITMADYLLYHMNKFNPYTYRKWSEPTNDVTEFLTSVALKTGCLVKGGVPNLEMAARRFIDFWEDGKFECRPFDDVMSVTTEQRFEWSERFKGMFQEEKIENEPVSTICIK